jgi:methenyltetrahydromethanopterin cyclohydrolase
MTENDVHKCLMSYGVFPMTTILKELEEQNRFEECHIIHSSILSYINRYPSIVGHIKTQWSKDFEKEYYAYFKNEEYKQIAKENLEWYLKDIKKRLQL